MSKKQRMTLQRSIGDMKPGDEWRSENYSARMANDKTLVNCQGASLRLDFGILNEYGEIIPAEPVFLSDEELLDLISEKNDADHNNWDISYETTSMLEFIDVCRKNFRLERDLELQESFGGLRATCLIGQKSGSVHSWELFLELIDNAISLKPLNPE
jgi:hypothetical protein